MVYVLLFMHLPLYIRFCLGLLFVRVDAGGWILRILVLFTGSIFIRSLLILLGLSLSSSDPMPTSYSSLDA